MATDNQTSKTNRALGTTIWVAALGWFIGHLIVGPAAQGEYQQGVGFGTRFTDAFGPLFGSLTKLESKGPAAFLWEYLLGEVLITYVLLFGVVFTLIHRTASPTATVTRISAMPSVEEQPPPPPGQTAGGWWPDPLGRSPKRYHDGTKWTEHVVGVDGSAGIDPPV